MLGSSLRRCTVYLRWFLQLGLLVHYNMKWLRLTYSLPASTSRISGFLFFQGWTGKTQSRTPWFRMSHSLQKLTHFWFCRILPKNTLWFIRDIFGLGNWSTHPDRWLYVILKYVAQRPFLGQCGQKLAVLPFSLWLFTWGSVWYGWRPPPSWGIVIIHQVILYIPTS